MPKYRRPIIFVGTRADMEPLLETAEELGIPVLGILDRFYVGKKVEGIDVIGSDLDLINPVSNPVTELLEYADFFVASYFSGTTNTEIDSQNIFQLRMERIDLVKQARCNLANLIHPNTQVSKTAQLGRNILIMPGSYIESHVKIGSFSTFMYYNGVAHHCNIGENCAVMPEAGMSGSVTVGKNVVVGINTRILSSGDATTIGDNVILAPGLTILKDISSNSIVQVNGKIMTNEKFTSDVYGGIGISPSYKRITTN